MRIGSSVTSLSWIPSEAVAGLTKLPFEVGVGHYDPPPPDHLDDLDTLREADRFRFANELEGWVEVEDARIVGYGQEGHGHIGSTTLRLGAVGMSIPAVAFPDIRPDPRSAATPFASCSPPAGAPVPPRPGGCAGRRSCR